MPGCRGSGKPPKEQLPIADHRAFDHLGQSSDQFLLGQGGEIVRISMDGRGSALDNIFVERLWRSVKYEDLHIKSYDTVTHLDRGLSDYFLFYNEERPHQGLDNQVPADLYLGKEMPIDKKNAIHLKSAQNWS